MVIKKAVIFREGESLLLFYYKITENLNPARIADWFCDREKRPVSCVYKTIHKDRENDSGYHIEYRMLF